MAHPTPVPAHGLDQLMARFRAPELTEAMTGFDSVDPLRQAFAGKTSAHAGRASSPLPADRWQDHWDRLSRAPVAELGPAQRLAYVHIPFCSTKCNYCGFFQNTSKKERIDLYVDALMREIQLSTAGGRLQQKPIQALYFGGGTPTELSPEQIVRLGKAFADYLPLSNDCEITFESRFHGFDSERMDACYEAGFNRFSMGVQSFNSKIRRGLSRIDSREQMLAQLLELTDYNQAVVVVDLIFGLPHQTMETWLDDLDTLINSPVTGVDLYQLIMMGSTRLAKQVEEGKMPPAATTAFKADLFKAGIEKMQAAHFQRLSVSHWTRNGRERNRYNHLVKAGAEVIPFGSGAGGNIAGHSTMLQRSLEPYFDAIDAGQKPMLMMTAPTPLQPLFNVAGKGFDLGWLDLKAMQKATGFVSSDFNWAEHCAPLFDAWCDRGLAERRGHFLDLTLAGQFWNVNISQGMQQYLQAGFGVESRGGGHPAGIPKTGGHPAGIPKTGGHPTGIPADHPPVAAPAPEG